MSRFYTVLLFLLLMAGFGGCTVDFSPAKEEPDASEDTDSNTDDSTDAALDAGVDAATFT